MKKKLICLALAVMMLGLGAVAFAESPSITADNIGPTVWGNNSALQLSIPAELTALAQGQLTALSAYAASGDVIDYFGADVAFTAAQFLPVGFDLSKLSLDEFISLTATVYDDSVEEVVMHFTFPTVYEDGTPVVAVLGIADGNGNVTWYALKAAVTNGNVDVTFFQEVLALMSGQELMLAILS